MGGKWKNFGVEGEYLRRFGAGSGEKSGLREFDVPPGGVRAKFRDVKGFPAAGFGLVGRERGTLPRVDHGDACVVAANFLWAPVDGDDVLPENRRWTTREPPNVHAAVEGRGGNPETGNASRPLSAGRPGKSGCLHFIFILLASDRRCARLGWEWKRVRRRPEGPDRALTERQGAL